MPDKVMYVVTWEGLNGQALASQPLTEDQADALMRNLVVECEPEYHVITAVPADMLTRKED